MYIEPELRLIKECEKLENKATISLMLHPKFLNMLDYEAAKLRVSRGDLLVSCLLRVVHCYKNKSPAQIEMETQRDDAEGII